MLFSGPRIQLGRSRNIVRFAMCRGGIRYESRAQQQALYGDAFVSAAARHSRCWSHKRRMIANRSQLRGLRVLS